MIELKKEFDGVGQMSGYKFTQLQKSENAFLYSLVEPEHKTIHFEVFKRVVSPEADVEIGGRIIHYTEREVYPNINQFGVTAWCFTNIDKAKEKFTELSNQNQTI